MGKRGPQPKSKMQAWLLTKKHVEKSEDECWLIKYGTRVGIGYKWISAEGKQFYAHRLAFEMEKGKIADEVVRHTCDYPNCVNPKHLIQGTHADNIADQVSRGRNARGEKQKNAVLKEEVILEIFNSKNLNYQQLSDIYGISRGGIHNIKNGRTWNHITGLPRIE